MKRGKKIKSPLRMSIFGMKGTLLAEQNRENSVGKWSLPANLKIAYASACPSFNGYSPLFFLNQGELWNTVLGLKFTIYLGIVTKQYVFLFIYDHEPGLYFLMIHFIVHSFRCWLLAWMPQHHHYHWVMKTDKNVEWNGALQNTSSDGIFRDLHFTPAKKSSLCIHTYIYIYITAKPKFENTLRYLRDYFNNAFSHVCLRLYTSEEIAFWLELLPCVSLILFHICSSFKRGLHHPSKVHQPCCTHLKAILVLHLSKL